MIEAFRTAMRRSGLDYLGPIYADGKLHRIRVESDHARNSWYVLHASPTAGIFGCWKRGLKETWCERTGDLSQAEWNRVHQGWQEADREREQAEADRRAKAREAAAWIIKRSTVATTHPYLATKRVNAHGNLRHYRGALALQLRDAAGELHSLQFIDRNGMKHFLAGGRVAGCYYTLADRPDGPIVIAEGYATGASIHEATGLATVAAMNCGNLVAVAQDLRKKWPEREIVIAGDNDQWTPANPGVSEATQAAQAIKAKLAIPWFKDTTGKPTDFNDLHQLEGLRAVKAQIEKAEMPKENDDQAFDRLAKLSLVDYDRRRDAEAKQLGIRVSTLDEEVAKRRSDTNRSHEEHTLEFPNHEPWPESVVIAELLDQIVDTARKYVVASSAALIAFALFVVHTYAFDFGDISPLLLITSPTKRCGKSRLLTLLMRFVHRPLAVSSASAAGIYRTIELYRPTLLIDEVDAFLKGDEQLRGLINAGHTREAAYHLGCVAVGDDFRPRRWSTWAPKVLSGIGHLPDTLEDRGIIIAMRRRKKDERVDRLRYRTRFDDLCRKITRWVADNETALRTAEPRVPEDLHDRAADNWTPLLAIADLAGAGWPDKARKAAEELSGVDVTAALGLKVLLLNDIRAVFEGIGGDRLASVDLSGHLAAMEGRPWAEFGEKKKPISPNQLAKLLAEFGVAPDSVRIGDKTPKGYTINQFSDAFERYLSFPKSRGSIQSATAQHPLTSAVETAIAGNATHASVAVGTESVSSRQNGQCCGVAAEQPNTWEEADLL